MNKQKSTIGEAKENISQSNQTVTNVGIGLTNRLVAKNNAARLYDISTAPRASIDIKDEYESWEADLKKFNERVKDQNEREKREAEDEAERQRLARLRKNRWFELNLDPDYWRKRFTYPYSLDLAPLKLPPPDAVDTFYWNKQRAVKQ